MAKMIEIGTVSSRGQIAIPSKIRAELDLHEGEKVLFLLDGTTLIIRKAMVKKTWEELTRPLRKAMKNMKEEDVPALVQKVRREKREKKK